MGGGEKGELEEKSESKGGVGECYRQLTWPWTEPFRKSFGLGTSPSIHFSPSGRMNTQGISVMFVIFFLKVIDWASLLFHHFHPSPFSIPPSEPSTPNINSQSQR